MELERRIRMVDDHFEAALASEIYVQFGLEDKVSARLRQNGIAAMVSVTAPGGVSKGELVKFVACEIRSEFSDGVLKVILGEKTPGQVTVDFAIECGLKFPPAVEYPQHVLEMNRYDARAGARIARLRAGCGKSASRSGGGNATH